MENLSVTSFECMSGLTVYVAQFDEKSPIDQVQPSERNAYVQAASDPLVRSQRYWVWRLLDNALCEQYGKTASELGVTRRSDGKWVSCGGSISFSLSHSGNVAAVAVADRAVGVDVELLDNIRRKFTPPVQKRTLTTREREHIDKLPERDRLHALAAIWSQKESVFKMKGGKNFVPSATDARYYCRCSRFVEIGNASVVLSVVARRRRNK